MHILYVTFGYKPAYGLGGPVWSVSATAEGMVARGHRVTVFTTNSDLDKDLDLPVDQPVMVEGVEVWYFRRHEPLKQYLPWVNYLSQSLGYMYAPALERAIRRILPTVDIVHTQMPYTYPNKVAGRLALAAGKPLFYNQRGAFHPSRLRYRRWKKLMYIALVERPIMRGATGLIALTDEEVDSYRALGVDTPCYVVPNGVDVGSFRRAARPGSLSDLRISGADKVILFLARLHPTKGADLLTRAFVMIAIRHPDAVLVLAGPDEHGLADNLRNIAAERGLSENHIHRNGQRRTKARFVGQGRPFCSAFHWRRPFNGGARGPSKRYGGDGYARVQLIIRDGGRRGARRGAGCGAAGRGHFGISGRSH